MASLLLAFQQILPVFLIVALGSFLRRIHLLSEEFNKKLSRLVFYALIPPLMFLGIADTRLAQSFDARLVFPTMLAVLLFSLVVYQAARPRLSASRLGVFTQGASRSNLVFVGLAILVNLYGEAVLGKAAVFIAFHALLINLLSVLFLHLPHHSLTDRAGWLKMAGQIAANPVIVGCALGMAWSASGLALPTAAKGALQTLSRAALPLALLIVGASLYKAPLRGQGPLLLAASLLKLVALPGLIVILLHGLDIRVPEAMIAVVLLGSPTAIISQIMAKEMDGDETLASAIVMCTTLLSPFTLTLWIGLLS
jgi:predicted permease